MTRGIGEWKLVCIVIVIYGLYRVIVSRADEFSRDSRLGGNRICNRELEILRAIVGEVFMLRDLIRFNFMYRVN